MRRRNDGSQRGRESFAVAVRNGRGTVLQTVAGLQLPLRHMVEGRCVVVQTQVRVRVRLCHVDASHVS
jgi:hypothetical protein